LVQEFMRRFPSLTTRSGAYDKCKLVSLELAAFLRKRGIKAHMLHIQIPNSVYPNACSQWLEKPLEEWSHYVVRIGTRTFDATARQFDPQADVPLVLPMSAIRSQWKTVEDDSFLDRWVREVLPVKEFNV
jgi:hypothetical protein